MEDQNTVQWFLDKIKRANELEESAKEHKKVTEEIKTQAREIAGKRDCPFEKEVTKPKPGQTITKMSIGDSYIVEVNSYKSPVFKIPVDVKARYEVDPNTIKKVTWSRRA